MKYSFVCLLLFCLTGALAQDRVIGHLGGKPVLESELKGSSELKRANHLYEQVVVPAVRAYLAPHEQRLKPTEMDVQQFMQMDRASKKCRGQPDQPEEDRSYAEWTVLNIKLQRFIYEQHGGGRLRFQQMGTEAFDATRTMILELERRGAFAIHDSALREMALDYWLKPHGPLMPDPGFDKAFKIEHAHEPCPGR